MERPAVYIFDKNSYMNDLVHHLIISQKRVYKVYCIVLFYLGGLSGKSGEENCIAMSAPSAWWYDDYCSTLHGSICKKRGKSFLLAIIILNPEIINSNLLNSYD